MNRVLLVEDEVENQLLVKGALGRHFDLACVGSIREALAMLDKTTFDLILLDVALPDGEGFQLCARLRNSDATRETPIIFLTGKDDVADKVTGFSLGADDYITKPFNPLELRARVESKLRKRRDQKDDDEVFLKGALKFNISSQKASLSEGAVDVELGLTPIEFKLLLFLARNEERVLTRDRLLTAVWGEGIAVTDRTVDKHIYSLRRKLGARAHYITTVAGVGYSFTLSAPHDARKAA